MFKRITPQTIADWGERIYIRFLELTKRFTSTQIIDRKSTRLNSSHIL